MKLIIVLAFGTMAMLASVSAVIAQRDGADRADRGSRLEVQEFRNDISEERLKKPAPTPLIPAEQSAADKGKGKAKKK